MRVLRKVAGEQGSPVHAPGPGVSRHLVACRGCRAGYGELVPVRAWLGRLAPAGHADEPFSRCHSRRRDWSDQ